MTHWQKVQVAWEKINNLEPLVFFNGAFNEHLTAAMAAKSLQKILEGLAAGPAWVQVDSPV